MMPIGAVLGGLLFRLLGLATTNVLGSLTAATVGAVAFLLALPHIKKAM